MTVPPNKFRMTLETSIRMSGARCSFVLFLMLSINAQTARTMNNHRLKRLTKADICNKTSDTVEPVQDFPKNSTVFNEQTRKKNCESLPKCNGKPLVYHCVRSNERIVEVCSPIRVIKGGYCAVFDKGIGRVIEDFSKPCKECPFKYQSADSVKYSSCFKLEATQTPSLINITLSQPEVNSTKTPRSPCCNSTRCERSAQRCHKLKSTTILIAGAKNQPAREFERENSSKHPPASSKEENSPVLYAALASVSVVLVISMVIFVFMRRGIRGFCTRNSNAMQTEKNKEGCTLYNTPGDENNINGTVEPLICNGKPDIVIA